MRALLTCLAILCAGPVQAMNWEGHDDWMAELEPALLYERALPRPRSQPPPAAACAPETPALPANPYEQIPLLRPDCRAPQAEREVQR